MKRIYFVSSSTNWDDSFDGSSNLAYWDEGTGEITTVYTNAEYDLGTGFIGKDVTGNILVAGPRYYRHVPYQNIDPKGSWWQGDVDSVRLLDDTIAYRLDSELKNPSRLFRDKIVQDFYGETGWDGALLYSGSPDWSWKRTWIYGMPDGNIMIVGRLRQPYSDADASEGRVIHIYRPDGTLVRRESLPSSGYWTGAQYPGTSSHGAAYQPWLEWTAYDSVRGYVYGAVDWHLWRWDLNTHQFQCAPEVFWRTPVQRRVGYDQTLEMAQELRTRRGRVYQGMIQGPYPEDNHFGAWPGSYGVVEAREYFKERILCGGIQVDERTGHIWALVQEPDVPGQEWAYDGTPTSPYPGGTGQLGQQYSLVCMDFDQMFIHEGERTYQPWPYTDGQFSDNYDNLVDQVGFERFYFPQSQPRQAQADLMRHVLVDGFDHVADVDGHPGLNINPSIGTSFRVFGSFTISPADPGFAYYSIDVPQESLAIPGDYDQVHAVYRVNLETGESQEVFRDLREDFVTEEYAFDRDYSEMAMHQLLVAEIPPRTGYISGTPDIRRSTFTNTLTGR